MIALLLVMNTPTFGRSGRVPALILQAVLVKEIHLKFHHMGATLLGSDETAGMVCAFQVDWRQAPYWPSHAPVTQTA